MSNNWFAQRTQKSQRRENNSKNQSQAVTPSYTFVLREDGSRICYCYQPYTKSLFCHVVAIYKTQVPEEYGCTDTKIAIAQKKKGIFYWRPTTRIVRFNSIETDADGNYYVYVARVPKDVFKATFRRQLNSKDYNGKVDTSCVNFWFDPLEIDLYNRLLARLEDNETQYYSVKDDGSFILCYSHIRGTLK